MKLKKILLMRLLSLSKYLVFLTFLTIISTSIKAEEESVDIWKKDIKKVLKISS